LAKRLQLTPRFTYNGKELQTDIGLFEYGFRWYDSMNARFTSVDPLAEKFPELTQFQYASNTPVQAIDLDGLEAFFVHGTFSSNSTWNKDFTKQMANATGWSTKDVRFGQWSGANNANERRKAAEVFYEYLTSDKNPLREGKHVTLISHSHGGNVSKELNNLLADDGWTVDLINIETPQREDFQVETLTERKYINFYSNEDLIQYLGTSGKNSQDGKARKDPKADANIDLK